MSIIAKYKFDQTIYEDFIPTFNDDFTNYTITDEIDTDGYTIRTIESNSLPTLIRFGDSSDAYESIGVLSLLKIDYVNIHNGIKTFNNFLANASNLISINTNGWDTSNITDMYAMFYYCYSLISLDLSNFDTNQVTNMNSIFTNCSSLTSLDVSNFDTSNTTSMSGMFTGCSSLISLDVSNFDTSQVTNISNMFSYCSSLTSLDVSNFDTSKVTNMVDMFHNCSSLTSLDVSNFNTEKVTNMGSMFYGCSSLISLDLSNFNTSQVTSMQDIFNNCSSLTSLDVSNFNTSQVTRMDNMFKNCSKLISLDVSNFNTSKVANMNNMFTNCSSLISLDLSSFNMENVTDTENMFTNCFNITDIGTVYCNSDTINKIVNLLTTNTTIWYSEDEVNVEELDVLENITYKPYKENRISYDGITLRSLPNGVKDEINVLTGEYIQRVKEVVLDGSESWARTSTGQSDKYRVFTRLNDIKSVANNHTKNILMCNKYVNVSAYETYGLLKGISLEVKGGNNASALIIYDPQFSDTLDNYIGFQKYLQSNPITVQYELAEPVIRQLDPQSLTPYQDGYISMEAEVNYPSFIYSLPSTNTFYIPKIKNMTQYTLKYPVGSGTVTIGNIQYNVTSDSMLFTTPIEITGDKNSLVFETDDNPTDIMILEGNYSNREVKYFTGINSVINPIIRVTNSLTGGSVEYKGDSDIALYSLPNKISDKLDVLTGYLMRVTGIREYQDGDYELDNVFTDGINTVYKLDSPLLYRNINFPTPTLNGYGTIELDSDEAIPQFNYRALSNNYYPIELLEPNTTYTMIGEAQASTLFTLGGTYLGNYEGGKVVVNLGNVTEKSLKFNNDIGLRNFMLVKGDATESTLPFYEGIKSVEDVTFTIRGYDEQENNFILGDSIVLRKCGEVYDAVDLIAHKLTKRLNEIDLTGLEYWSVEASKSVDSEYQLFSLGVASAKDSRNATVYCDKLPHNYLATSNNNQECIYFENNKLYLCIKKLTIGGDNVNALKTWLTKDNIKIIYPLINNVVLDLDVVWEVDPPISYETQTEFDTIVALGTLKPMLAITVATTTLEDIVSTLETQNAKLEEENIATMLALTGIYETMVVPTITSEASTYNLSDGKDGTKVTGMSISPMGMIYAKLVNKGFRTIEQVPAHLQAEVMYVLRGGE